MFFGDCVLHELLVRFSVETIDGYSDRGKSWECSVADLAKSCLVVLSRECVFPGECNQVTLKQRHEGESNQN